MATESSDSGRSIQTATGGLEEHPSPETLAAYHAGELPEEEMESLRDHLAGCPQCARLVLDLDKFEDLQPPAGREPVSRAEVESAWKDLRERLRRDPD